MSKLRHWRKKYGWTIAALLMLFLALTSSGLLSYKFKPSLIASKTEKNLYKQQDILHHAMSGIEKIAAVAADPKELWSKAAPIDMEKSGIGVAVYKNDSLVYWSSSLIGYDRSKQLQNSGRVKKLPTGWFYCRNAEAGAYRIEGYILIKRIFPYRNQYIRSEFHNAFRLPVDLEIKIGHTPNSIDIQDTDGSYLYSLTNLNQQNFSQKSAIVLALLYLLFFLSLLGQINLWLSKQKRITPPAKLLIVTLLSTAIYLTVNQRRVPSILFKIDIFSPEIFAYGSFLASLGEYLILSALMLYIAHSFFYFFRSEQFISPAGRKWVPLIFFGLYFGSTIFLIRTLLENSSVTLDLLVRLRPSGANILAFAAVMLQTTGLGIILIRLKALNTATKSDHLLMIMLLTALISLTVIKISGLTSSFYPLLYLLVCGSLIFFPTIAKLQYYRLTFLLMFSAISAMYINISAHHQLEIKKEKEQRLWAVNLASERDPAAELFLSDFEKNMKSDSTILNYFTPPFFGLENYLRNNYFTGFWRNYELQVTPCNRTDTLLLEGEERRFHCMEFFETMIESMGVLVPGSNFYYMNQMNGRISYLGKLVFDKRPIQRPLALFISLNSKIIPEGKGYPQLLLDEQASRRNRETDFNYAKYFGGKLVDRHGEFPYTLTPPPEATNEKEFVNYQSSGYNHCIYHRGGDNFVIVSYPVNKLLNRIGTFPYLFLILYFSGFVWIIFNRKTTGFAKKQLDFREKIQITLVLTLFATLTLIGLWLILYNFSGFKLSLKEHIEEKLRAISSEVEYRVGLNDNLSNINESLDDQLMEISDITWTDINLYDTSGRLAATSRKEIFSLGLNSGIMDPDAYKALALHGDAIYLHNEMLGRMKFFSAYVPIFNIYDQLVGFVNLPYYSRQEDFTREVSGFIVAFSNIYIFLILLSLFIALIISNKLTAPLIKIEANLKGIALGKFNAKIDYEADDEIGRLAKAYNKKVDELAKSAALLARSERETAWKEMARQIAHEINNPLTPMKLNIQHLQRIKKQGSERFDEYFEKATKGLIDQIDLLSSIASAFSDFAKISTAHAVPVNLNEKIKEVVFLFANSEKVKVVAEMEENSHLIVIGDKNHLSRALVNLVKNGIQAIPPEREGRVIIRLEKSDNMAVIYISDNGTGIPKSIHQQLFEPNFTTKNSGMGLGLAITKRIVENMKGEIRFQTSPDFGTTFIIEIPLATI